MYLLLNCIALKVGSNQNRDFSSFDEVGNFASLAH